jgi:hypothetical protein
MSVSGLFDGGTAIVHTELLRLSRSHTGGVKVARILNPEMNKPETDVEVRGARRCPEIL